MYIIFALPDYSSEVIERLQNLFYGRLTDLALEFDVIVCDDHTSIHKYAHTVSTTVIVYRTILLKVWQSGARQNKNSKVFILQWSN